MANSSSLNALYGIDGALAFEGGPGGAVFASMESAGSRARVALLGATVVSYVPAGGAETLFLARRASFRPGTAIRGGIPLCLPWFGPGPAGMPRHGFFRLLEWEVESGSREGGAVSLTLSLRDSPESAMYWAYRFRATCKLTLGPSLRISVSLRNEDERPFELSCAFHPYFRFTDLSAVELPGLEGARYDDDLAGDPRGTGRLQEGPLRVDGPIDRPYALQGPVDLVDRSAGRRLRVSGAANESIVVWTPWSPAGRALPDLDPDEHRAFLCVEPAIVPPFSRRIGPGESFEAGMEIEAGRLSATR